MWKRVRDTELIMKQQVGRGVKAEFRLVHIRRVLPFFPLVEANGCGQKGIGSLTFADNMD